MKNPFPTEVREVQVCIINPLTEGEFSMHWIRDANEQPLGMTKEQAAYAAQAINNYEELTTERDTLRRELARALKVLAGVEHCYPGRFHTGLDKDNIQRSKDLAALLAEEEDVW